MMKNVVDVRISRVKGKKLEWEEEMKIGRGDRSKTAALFTVEK
jgi:hypothetical protein